MEGGLDCYINFTHIALIPKLDNPVSACEFQPSVMFYINLFQKY